MPELVRLPDDLEQDEDAEPQRTLDMELDPPVLFQKKPFSSIHLEEPTGAMLESAEQELVPGPNAYTLRRYQITLIARVAKVPREVVLAMRESQIEEAFGFLSRLRDAGRRTGET